jgi:hypothetical protein
MTDFNRDSYPLNEPIFPNWYNFGAEIEETDGYREMNWRQKSKLQDIINTGWAEWRFMQIQLATSIDEHKRQCQWCLGKSVMVGELVPFVKDTIVIREQYSSKKFNTLHLQCAIEKLQAIKENIEAGQEKLNRWLTMELHQG